MPGLRYFLKNISLINLVLAGALIYLVQTVALPFFNRGVVYQPPAPKKVEETKAAEKAKAADAKGPSPMDYVIIADQNPFHPDRKIPVPKVEAPPLPKPDFILYGTMEAADISVAYMEDKKAPKTTQGRGKRITTVKLGESLSGFILKEVDPEKVVMTRGDESIIVYLNDRTKVREGSGPATPAGPGHPPRPVTQSPPPAPHPPAAHVTAEPPPVPPAAEPPATRPKRVGLFGNKR